METLKELYNKEILPSLKKEYGYTSDMQVPRLEKNSSKHGSWRCFSWF